MMDFKIGVISDSFRLPLRDGLCKARELGAEGVQIWAVSGEVCPEALSLNDRKELKSYCSDLKLEIAALCGDLGGHGFEREDENPEKIRKSKAIVDLAADMEVRVITTHIGVIPADRDSPTRKIMLAALRELATYAEHRQVVFAIETGPETAHTLADFLEEVGSPGLGVNLDPANFIMVTGDDPAQAVYTLKDHIVHTHAKDGVKLAPCDPVEVYRAFAEGRLEGFDFGKLFDEKALGDGTVNWDAYLKALDDIGYHGFLTIEREVGDDPVADIRKSIQFLKNILGR